MFGKKKDNKKVTIGGCPNCGSKKRSGGEKDSNTGVRTWVCKECGKKYYTGGY